MFINLMPAAIGIRGLSLPQNVELAHEHGFAGVDFGVAEATQLADERGIEHVKALFDRAGVRPGGWGTGVNVRGDDQQFSSSLAALPRYADVALALGSDRALGGIWPGSDERPFAENYSWHVDRLGRVAEVLKAHGCRLGLEFIGTKTLRARHAHEFVYTMDGALELARAIGTGNVGLLLDLWHLYASHGSVEDVRRLSNADVVAVHVNDAPAGIPVDEQIDTVRMMPLETGVLDVVAFLRELAAIGYDGPVSCEPFSQRISSLPAATAAAETAATMRRAFAAAGL